MKDTEINEAIADHVGWKWYAVEKGGWFYREGGHGYTYRINEAGKYTKEDAEKQLCYGEPMSVVQIPVPDYVNDLNAMAEAEQFLDSTNGGITDPNCLRYAYSSEVYRIVPDTIQPFRASARHRAEAFLRTVGKWKEAKP